MMAAGSGDFVVVCGVCDGFLDDVKVDVEHVSVGVINTIKTVASAAVLQSFSKSWTPKYLAESVPV
jgi:formylmethanofuran dehydrogenase subunit B